MPKQINLNDPCICGSNKLTKECCLMEFSPSIPEPESNLINSKCYASISKNCSEKISREHYISHGILKELSTKYGIEVTGFPWSDKKKTISTNALTSKILCNRHNAALSGLDSVAKKFFVTIIDIIDSFKVQDEKAQDEIFLFNGYDIEKWMLKTLIGIGFSKNASSNEEVIKDWMPDSTWIDILFNNSFIPESLGFYFSGKIGEESFLTIPSFEIAPISNKNAGIYGSVLRLCGMQMIMVMAQPPVDKKDTILQNHIYRPNELIYTNGNYRKIIVFNWNTEQKGGSITIDLSKK